MIAALYVEKNGCYFGLPDVDPWDKDRDARLYAGPWPVVAHPPCERWGRYWFGGPSAKVRRKKGDDGGCFASALAAVRQFGGVLEHPEASSAWAQFGLNAPAKWGGWVVADFYGGWTCCVEQGNYGHRARKATWLYANGVELPSLNWGPAPRGLRPDEGFHSAEERRRAIKTGICQRLSRGQRLATPVPFRDLLLGIARTVKRAPRPIPIPSQPTKSTNGEKPMSVWDKIDAMKKKHDAEFSAAKSELESLGATKSSLTVDNYGQWRCRYIPKGERKQESLTARTHTDLISRLKAIREREAQPRPAPKLAAVQ